MTRKHFVTAIIFGLTGVLSFACAEPNWAGEDLKETKEGTEATGDDDDAKAGDGAAESTCVDTADVQTAAGDDKPGVDVDVSSLEACCKEEPNAKAYCVPEEKLSSVNEALGKCGTGGRCIPESLIKGEVPKSCKSTALGDPTPGVCLSPCIKKIGENKGILKADGCAAGLLCAPCDLGGKPTGACDIGKSSGGSSSSGSKPAPKTKCPAKPPVDPKPAPDPKPTPEPEPTPGGGGGGGGGCCGGKGLCATKEVIESRMPGKSGSLEAKECTEGKLCAPLENAQPGFKPKTCKGKALTGAYTGVCLSNCIAFSTLQKSVSEQGDCDSDHRCLPCKVLGLMPSGAPGCE